MRATSARGIRPDRYLLSVALNPKQDARGRAASKHAEDAATCAVIGCRENAAAVFDLGGPEPEAPVPVCEVHAPFVGPPQHWRLMGERGWRTDLPVARPLH
jgi:hypothetical protein